MAETLSNAAKTQIMRKLRSQGYPSYARLLDLFDIYLTDNPDVIGYMEPKKAMIVLINLLDIEQVSTIVRHEILHEYFTHMERTQKFNSTHKELLPLGADHEASNIAADFEISNKGYTDEDKRIARAIRLGDDKVLRGLVTEDQFPGWENMSFEEMYEKILEERKKDSQQIKKLIDIINKLNKKELEDMVDELEDIENGESSTSPDENGKSSPSSGTDKDNDDNNNDDDSGSATANNNESTSKEEKELQDKAGKLKDEIEKIQDKLGDELQQNKQSPNNKSNGEGVFSKGKKVDPDLLKRVAQIEEIFADIKAKDELLNDSKRAKQKEKITQKANNERARKEDPLSNFKLNLNRFIADQIEEMEDESNTRIHPSYEDSDFILPGRLTKENKNIPLIAIYQDASGSFDDPAKTEMAYKAIDTLRKYEREGKIKIKKYYHANIVGLNREDVGWGNNGDNVIRHINETNPTNVIIITDGDLSDTRLDATVPGAVWMLFYGARSEGLMKHLRGKKQTKFYDVKWNSN